MSAIVVSDEGDDWFTNSYTWSTILEIAFGAIEQEQRDRYRKYANTIGADFELMPEEVRPEIAGWLLAAIEDLLGPAGAEHGWDKPSDREHLGELAGMLRRMAHRGSA
ncbi:hypothetical protein [Catenulispora subtropica]|uniref:Uncharacterized protein n=1 Tax=Catenulispora subtropica TaxID=450798 RepID=A0ABN2T7D7_9ACTN